MKNWLVRRFLLGPRLPRLEQTRRLYDAPLDPMEIARRQTAAWNETWDRCLREIPFYQHWRRAHKLPGRVSSLDEVADFPPLTKQDLQQHRDLLFHQPGILGSISTGGSTGEPTAFPTGGDDVELAYALSYTGKSWWGVEPLDRIAFFWGHSHLFGTGLKGRVNEAKRRLQDWCINTRRFNAYDMTPATLARYLEGARRFRPLALVGYTSCLYKLGRHVLDSGQDGARLFPDLRVAIATSETVSPADVDVMQRAFGAPVALEYGMAETGVIAYSRGETRDLRIFWDSYAARVNSEGVLHLCTIGGRFFPLVNYRTEDVVAVREAHGPSVLALSSVQGRARDVLRIGTIGGEPLCLSGILMVHLLKLYPGLYSIQFEQTATDAVRIHLVSDRELDLGAVRAYFMREVGKDHPALDGAKVEFVQADAAARSVAGKETLLRGGA
jgi:phenylacetate-coenzyme A ligase PaaK-like adenylate-forming protein